MSDPSLGRYLAAQAHAWEDAKRRGDYAPKEMTVYTQMWSDTSRGFGGMAGQMTVRDVTTLAWSGATCRVYIGRRYAYTVHRPTEIFLELMRKRDTPGQQEFQRNRSEYDQCPDGRDDE